VFGHLPLKGREQPESAIPSRRRRKPQSSGHAKLRSAGSAVTADIAVYAHLAMLRGGVSTKPAPLYLREPDAKPQASFMLPRAGG
jgi:hypothetical protein